MIFLYIHLLISGACLILYALSVVAITHRFRTEYPDLRVPKSSKADVALSIIKLIFASYIPLFNIFLFKVLMFDYEETERKTIKKILRRCAEAGGDPNETSDN